MLLSHLRMLFLVCLFALGAGTSLPVSYLDRIKDTGYLKIAILQTPDVLYGDSNGLAGFDYELADALAQHLDVQLSVIPIDRVEDGMTLLQQGKIDLLATGIVADDELYPELAFAPAYDFISTQLIYRGGQQPPSSISDVVGQSFMVANGSNEATVLRQLQRQQPQLSWQEADLLSSADLLQRVADGQLDYTLITDRLLNQLHDFYPNLKSVTPIASPVNAPQPIAWALKKRADQSLLRATREFLMQSEVGYLISTLNERYFGHLKQIDRISAYYFKRRLSRSLPKYRSLFITYAEQNDLDWRLLAAMGYQESHWRPNAISQTGVRGLMMLTRITAAELGIRNRVDPENSIRGGAEYISKLLKRIPADVVEPDRTWFALAAYNVGYGHLNDARKLTEELGGDGRLWVDVKETLPLLRQPKYYKRTQYGFARGDEPVTYVQNIRRYYEMLIFEDKGGLTLADNQDIQAPNVTVIPPLL